MSESEETRDDRYADVDTSHLDGVEDGCGCTEIWEHTSGAAERSEAAGSASGSDEGERHASGEAASSEANRSETTDDASGATAGEAAADE